MTARIAGALRALNTHKVFGVGIVTALVSLAIIGAAQRADATITCRMGCGFLRFWLDTAAQLAWIAIAPAIAAAGLGRPTTIPQPTSPAAEGAALAAREHKSQ